MPATPEVEARIDPIPYAGYEIHITVHPAMAVANRHTYIGYVSHPGASPALPGHTVPFHPNGEESFASIDEAVQDATRVGRLIVDGAHPDLSVQSLVTRG